ncbi:hypothetical protein EJ08DRAFT_17480 [Tothia fuscella]|uniref:Uncharacterized protein n=1 Tax=Tothia fuscella TaxID=1048955 RepID=A0A9P4U1J3_9PEZI|nr:hypothetical protein EJ08DRAFT_17480 [Tothia fuscella]
MVLSVTSFGVAPFFFYKSPLSLLIRTNQLTTRSSKVVSSKRWFTVRLSTYLWYKNNRHGKGIYQQALKDYSQKLTDAARAPYQQRRAEVTVVISLNPPPPIKPSPPATFSTLPLEVMNMIAKYTVDFSHNVHTDYYAEDESLERCTTLEEHFNSGWFGGLYSCGLEKAQKAFVDTNVKEATPTKPTLFMSVENSYLTTMPKEELFISHANDGYPGEWDENATRLLRFDGFKTLFDIYDPPGPICFKAWWRGDMPTLRKLFEWNQLPSRNEWHDWLNYPEPDILCKFPNPDEETGGDESIPFRQKLTHL